MNTQIIQKPIECVCVCVWWDKSSIITKKFTINPNHIRIVIKEHFSNSHCDIMKKKKKTGTVIVFHSFEKFHAKKHLCISNSSESKWTHFQTIHASYFRAFLQLDSDSFLISTFFVLFPCVQRVFFLFLFFYYEVINIFKLNFGSTFGFKRNKIERQRNTRWLVKSS